MSEILLERLSKKTFSKTKTSTEIILEKGQVDVDMISC